MTDQAVENTDKLIWRRDPENPLSASIHVTKEGGFVFNKGGRCLVVTMDVVFAALVDYTIYEIQNEIFREVYSRIDNNLRIRADDYGKINRMLNPLKLPIPVEVVDPKIIKAPKMEETPLEVSKRIFG